MSMVTVVIPCYNEEKTIGEFVKRSKPFCDRVVAVIAKKTKDKSEDVARKAGAEILIDNGIGKGDGMRIAIDAINDGVIVFIDADGSHIPEDIPKLVEPIKNGKADMVIGSRFLGGSEELHGDFNKFLRMFFGMSIAQIINWRFKKSIQDTQNGFRAIKASVAKDLKLKSDIFDIETEMVMKCYKGGYKILEVPSMELRRRHGESGISLMKMGWKYAWRVFVNLW